MINTSTSFLNNVLPPGFQVFPQYQIENAQPVRTAIIKTISGLQTAELSVRYAAKMNVIRFMAICSIVWCHSLYGWDNRMFQILHDQLTQAVMMQIGRIGTVCFFIISGYFLADKLNQYTVFSYFKHRWQSIILPWISILLLFVALQIARAFSLDDIMQKGLFAVIVLSFKLFKSFIFHAAYWFIPVSILSALILILFKKHLNKKWFAIILAGITVFYGINLYTSWVPANHTMAVLGYVFFMWLGVQIKYHLCQFETLIVKIPWTVIAPLMAILFIAACFEGFELQRMGSVDPYASIRISNALLSAVVFIAFIKTRKFIWINKLQPQKYVYGIYLVHSIVISGFNTLLNQLTQQLHLFTDTTKMVMFQIPFFVVIFVLTYLIVVVIKRSSLHILIGK